MHPFGEAIRLAETPSMTAFVGRHCAKHAPDAPLQCAHGSHRAAAVVQFLQHPAGLVHQLATKQHTRWWHVY